MNTNFYVYVYLDPRKPGKYTYNEYTFDFEPFYIGKGKGNRFNNHLIKYKLRTNKNKMFVNKILKIQSSQMQPIIIKVQENLNEQTSFQLEKSLIISIGRKDKNLGTLTNMTDGGEGSSGYIMTDKQKEKCRQTAIKYSDKHSKRMKENNPTNDPLVREKISQIKQIQNKGSGNPMFGKLGKDNPNFGKPNPNAIDAMTKSKIKYKCTLLSPSNETIEVTNLNEFFQRIGINSSKIYQVIKGKRKSHKGWTVLKVQPL